VLAGELFSQSANKLRNPKTPTIILPELYLYHLLSVASKDYRYGSRGGTQLSAREPVIFPFRIKSSFVKISGYAPRHRRLRCDRNNHDSRIVEMLSASRP
jgi:hypothetical protein